MRPIVLRLEDDAILEDEEEKKSWKNSSSSRLRDGRYEQSMFKWCTMSKKRGNFGIVIRKTTGAVFYRVEAELGEDYNSPYGNYPYSWL